MAGPAAPSTKMLRTEALPVAVSLMRQTRRGPDFAQRASIAFIVERFEGDADRRR